MNECLFFVFRINLVKYFLEILIKTKRLNVKIIDIQFPIRI